MKTTVIQILWSIDMYPTEIQIALENETIMEMLKNHLLMVRDTRDVLSEMVYE